MIVFDIIHPMTRHSITVLLALLALPVVLILDRLNQPGRIRSFLDKIFSRVV